MNQKELTMADAKKVDITPDTGIGSLLDAYPALEEVLIGMSPAFSVLRNPILRSTVAGVASLRQLAEIGNVPLADLINTLRSRAFQSSGEASLSHPYTRESGAPLWFDPDRVTARYDARADLNAGVHPLQRVMNELEVMKTGEIYELVTPFKPVPLIDAARAKGFDSWSNESDANIVNNYFCIAP
jgi:hypothetical protein